MSFPVSTTALDWCSTELTLWDGPKRGQTFVPMAFQRGIFEAWQDPEIHTIVTQKCAQSGISTIMFALMAYSAKINGRPMVLYLPTDGKAEETAKEKLAPMLEANPVVGDLITDDTIGIKHFVGGYMAVLGTENENNLSSRTVPFLFFDEVDRMKNGKEGCPIAVGTKRSQQYKAEKKRFICSTPTIAGHSKVETHYDRSDKRLWHVPCPACGTFQPLEWSQVGWQRDPRTGASLPGTAYYGCKHCDARWSDADRLEVIELGYWQATAPSNGTAGFQITSLALPYLTLEAMAREYIESKGDFAARQAFHNTVLGLPWAQAEEAIDSAGFLDRRDPYSNDALPNDIIVVTAAGDIQTSETNPRVEVEIVGWDQAGRSWSLDYLIIPGSVGQVETWQALDGVSSTKFKRADGAQLGIAAFALDCSDGNVTNIVAAECKRRRNWYAIKGVDGISKPIWDNRPGAVRKQADLTFWRIGTDAARTRHVQSLRIKDPTAPGYCFFPNREIYGEDYFAQLTNKRKVNVQNKRRWDVVDKGTRHEAFDVRVYNIALFEMIRTEYSLPQIARNLSQAVETAKTNENTGKPQSRINSLSKTFGAR